MIYILSILFSLQNIAIVACSVNDGTFIEQNYFQKDAGLKEIIPDYENLTPDLMKVNTLYKNQVYLPGFCRIVTEGSGDKKYIRSVYRNS